MRKEVNENDFHNQAQTGNNIEVWEDLVSIKDLVVSLVICSITTLGGYLIAPNKPPKPLLFGLVGAVLGFVMTSLIIKPKRYFRYIEKEE